MPAQAERDAGLQLGFSMQKPDLRHSPHMAKSCTVKS